MQTIRTFKHDGEDFEIRAELKDGIWKAAVFFHGHQLGGPAMVSEQTVADGVRYGKNLPDDIANELQRAVEMVSIEIIRAWR